MDVDAVATSWKEVLVEQQGRRLLVPITGAGVGKNFGLPDWDPLLDGLSAYLMDKGCSVEESEDKLTRAVSIMFAIEGLERCDDTIAKGQVIREVLYRNLTASKTGVLYMSAIHGMSRTSGSYVTLNFDDLYESFVRVNDPNCECMRGDVSHRPLDERAQESELLVKCFHPHGCVPVNDERIGPTPVVLDSLGYARVYAKGVDSLEVDLLHLMQNYFCVFIGLSMTDVNLLRLLVRTSEMRSERGDGRQCWGLAIGDYSDTVKQLLAEVHISCAMWEPVEGEHWFETAARELNNAVGWMKDDERIERFVHQFQTEYGVGGPEA